jgi:hypothetical protein
MSAVPDRLELLRRSWTMVADGYLQHFVPRFAPWTRQTLQLLADSAPPHAGTIAVPACGPGGCPRGRLPPARLPPHLAAATATTQCTPRHSPACLQARSCRSSRQPSHGTA